MYDHNEIEKKWQDIWEKNGSFHAEDASSKPKYYCLIEFPYPSGDGLHVGHIRSNTAMDIVARKRWAEGYNVLYPIGWDAFGLPTENYAIKTKTSPQIVTKQNTDNFRHQLKSLGFSFDWAREINTTDPEYYKWTQWIFIKMWEKGLAYKRKMPINWCLTCKIGLANEEVVDGACERCGGTTEKRDKEQWMLAITKYADRLYDDLDRVNYLEKIKTQQRNWIGKSDGAEVTFAVESNKSTIGEVTVFTTRPDTLFGATYLVVAPEHALLNEWKAKIENWNEVEKYINTTRKKTEIERTSEGKEKTGVELKGIKAINPANQEELPVFIADYVLGHYGTGAIMAVPAHDERDFEFAKKFGLPIKIVIEPITGETHDNEEPRKSIVAVVHNKMNDTFLSINWGDKLGGNLFVGGGREGNEDPIDCAVREIAEETGYKNIKFISSSEPIHHHYVAFSKGVNRNIEAIGLYFELENDERVPLKHEENEKGKFSVEWISRSEVKSLIKDRLHSLVFERLINKAMYSGMGIMRDSGDFSGLTSLEAGKAITKFVGGKLVTTYKLRDWVFSRQRYWGEPIPLVHCEKDGWVAIPDSQLPVLLPEIGAYTPTDTGESPLSEVTEWVDTTCPTCGGAAKRETDTMPQWAGSSWYFLAYVMKTAHNFQFPFSDYKQLLNHWMPVDWYNGGMEHTTLHLLYSRFWHKFLFDIGVVSTDEPYAKRTSHGMILAEGGEKMSKSRGNTINPESIVETYGADTLRVYEMFMGPFGQSVSWSTESIIGPRRFLERVWKIQGKVVDGEQNDGLDTAIHKSVKKISEDIESLSLNTAVSALMILVNEIEKAQAISKENYEIFLKLLAPFAPHIAEELWHKIGNTDPIHLASWPKFDVSKIIESEVVIAIQVNGKLRDTVSVSKTMSSEALQAAALERPLVAKWLENQKIKKVITVPGKLLNIVIGE